MEERESREQVIGLTLQLQKFGVGKVRDKNDMQANTILGHYDHLVIRRVERWLEYSPRMDWESGIEGTDDPPAKLPATHYPIKLLFPYEDGTDRLAGFHYDAWKHHEDMLEENPCMTVVLLNLTDVYKARVDDDLLGAFLQLLRNGCEEKLLSEVHCCVLPSLGYSDFCILMAGKDWGLALQLVERLHSLTVPSSKGNTRVPVLSTDYMMPVCHPKAGAALDEKFSDEYFKGIELTVRVNLCPGVTAQQLADRLEGIQVYRTSGGSDCLLWAKDGQAQALMRTLMGDTERNIVIDMASTPQLHIAPSGQKAPPDLPLMKIDALTQGALALAPSGRISHSFDEAISNFKAAIQRYAEKLRTYDRHNRQVRALQELETMIEGICMQPHTGALRDLMENLVNSFSNCLERCAREMSQPDWEFSEMEEFVAEFSDIVGYFLEDLSRSDCFYMDREKYKHASVSSATSLLIAYNQWLNEFTDAIREATQEENRSHYSFLVTSGGRDQTQTTNTFYFLKPNIDEERRDELYEDLPLIIQMSEMSLFDFSGTILRSFHECMHHVGARRRRERLPCFLRFVIGILSARISWVLMDGESCQQAKDVLAQLKESCQQAEHVLAQPEETFALQREAEQSYEELRRALAEDISRSLWSYFPEAERTEWNEENYLCENVRIWTYERLMLAFSGYVLSAGGGKTPQLHQNRFAADIYESTLKAQKAFRRKCDELCRTHGISSVVFEFSAQRLDVLRESYYGTFHRADAMLSCQIQMILARLLISQPPEGMLTQVQADEADTESYEKWNRKFPYIMLTQHNINNILQGTADIFSETFADVSACTILEASLEDYLLMHVYEDWDLDSALGLNEMSMTYRIPSVLRLCFSDSLEDGGGRLTREARQRVETAIARLVGHGMPASRLDADKLCGRVDQLLEVFTEAETTGAPLLEYLLLCRQDYQTPEVKKKMRRFSEAFQKVRLFAVDPEEGELQKRLAEMYTTLCSGWRGEDGGRKGHL